MPKMKTHRGAAKRFRYTGAGRIRRAKAYKSHLLAKKSSRRKRRLGQLVLVNPSDQSHVRRLLPYS
ncbi:MAG: 50S ribosomal protein L35 [Clostridia bacterium]|jgi:large subunit ribosomal protein L35|nr:50S ribosomal protein L35 [Clostridia bacterium]